ncbi:MAG: hypothetical protein EBU12_08875 [Microbacteriaceae bacterium]|nr:hypothetical protein [Microbacteriaceae bacterium]
MQILAGVGATARVSVAGYFGGGYDGTNNLSGIDKITFPADSKTTLSATLTTARSSLTGVANSGVAGYFVAGYDTAVLSGIDKIAFPADTKTTLSATASTAHELSAGFADSGVAGYYGGGDNAAGTEYSFIDKLAFPAETRSTMTTTLTSARRQHSGFGNNGVAGYFCGGNASDIRQNNIQKISFTSDSSTTLAATLTVRIAHGTFADNGVAGYICGGNANASNGSGGNFTSIDKIAFPADTKTTLAATLTNAANSLSGFANSGLAGYACGGRNATGTSFFNNIDKIALPADTKSTLSATLTSARSSLAGFSDQGVF